MTKVIDFLINYWWVIIVIIAAIVAIGYGIYVFVKKPRHEQIAKIKEWLLYAVAAAEKELGSGTGALKLRTVYDMFIKEFPKAAKWISFETFSILVDDALKVFKELVDTNTSIKAYIESGAMQ